MYNPSTSDLNMLKELVGVTDSSKDQVLRFYLTKAGNSVLSSINSDTLPDELVNVVIEIANDAYALKTGGTVGAVNSVSDNGQSVSYSSDAVIKAIV